MIWSRSRAKVTAPAVAKYPGSGGLRNPCQWQPPATYPANNCYAPVLAAAAEPVPGSGPVLPALVYG